FFEGLQAAVVHVGTGVLDLAKSRRFESAFVLLFFGDDEATEIGFGLIHSDPDVLIGAVGEVESNVATVAGGLIEEDVHSADLRIRHRRLVAGVVSVEWSISRVNGTLERGNRLRDVVDRDVRRPENLLESLLVIFQSSDPLDAGSVGRIRSLLRR